MSRGPEACGSTMGGTTPLAARELMETGGKCASSVLRRGGSRHFVEAVPVRFLVVDEAGGCHVRWLNMSRRMRVEVR